MRIPFPLRVLFGGALVLSGCDRVESVTFTQKVGVVDSSAKPVVFEVDVDCEPSDTAVTLPLFERPGIVQVLERPDKTLLARSEDGRTYLLNGTRWERDYVNGAWQAYSGEKYSFGGELWRLGVREAFQRYVGDIWFPPDTGDVVLISSMEYWRGDLYSPDIDREAEGSWIPPEDLPPVPPNDYLWSAMIEYLPQPPEKYSYCFRDDIEMISDQRVATWWSAVFGHNRYDFVAVGFEARGPGAATNSISEAVTAAASVTGRIEGYSYFIDDELDIPSYEPWGLSHEPDVPLVDVFGTSAFDFWVVGNALSKTCPRVTGKIFHCNDEKCAEAVSIPGAFLKSIHGESGKDFYVVGGNDEQNAGAIVLRYEKGDWRRLDPPTDLPLNSVRVVPSGTAYVVGGGYSETGEPGAVALALTGGEWEVLPVESRMPLFDVLAVSDNDVHIVGEEGFFHYPAFRENGYTDIAIADTCEHYCQMLAFEMSEGLRWQDYLPACASWITDLVSQGPSCRHEVFRLMRCLTQSAYSDVRPILMNPAAAEGACVREHAAVECTDFSLVTNLLDF